MTNHTQPMHIDNILLDINADNVKQVFQHLSKHVCQLIGTPEEFLLSSLWQREERQNSGIGHGVAVLDAKLPRLTRPIIIYSTIAKPIEYNASDNEPVDMIALVLSPEFEGSKHLQRLAMVTRFFNDTYVRNTLRQADSYDDIRMVVKDINERKKVA